MSPMRIGFRGFSGVIGSSARIARDANVANTKVLKRPSPRCLRYLPRARHCFVGFFVSAMALDLQSGST